MPYNQRSFALKHHHGTRLFLCRARRRTTMLDLDKKYHYAREPTRMVVRWATLSSSSYIETSDSSATVGLCRSIRHYEPAQAQILPGLRVQLGGGHTPSCCHPCQDITDREKEGCRSRVNERKEWREAAITSQVAVGLIARTLGLPNWGIEKETRGD